MTWLALCNGGPNDTTVGKECKSMGQAIGTLEYMMKNLGATIGHVEAVPDGQPTGEVKTEAEASKWKRRTRKEMGLPHQTKIDWKKEQEIVDEQSDITGDDCSDELELLKEMTK